MLREARRLAHGQVTRLAWFALCALFVTWPLFSSAGQLNEFRDAQVLQNYEMAGVESVRAHGEVPLWNPYACGGMVNLGTPQSRVGAPPFLLSVLFGALEAPPLIALFLGVLGMEGFYRYVRARSASALSATLLATLFGSHGTLSWSFYHGWVNFYGFALIPWILYGVHLTSQRQRKGPLVVALSFAFITGFGGTYAAPIGALLALCEGVRTLLAARPAPRLVARSFGMLALAASLALLVSAYRLWPLAETLIAAPRIMAGAPRYTLEQLAVMAFEAVRYENGRVSHGGQMFVGLWCLPLVMLCFSRRRALVPLLLGLAAVWLAVGYQTQPSLFALLRELPIFGTLRYPQRFLFVASLFAFEAAALGLDGLLARSRRQPVRGVALLGVTAVLVGLSLSAQHAQSVALAEGMWLSPPPAELHRPFKQARGNRWLSAYYPALARGSLGCWEAYPVPMSPRLRSDLPQEEYLLEPDAGRVERLAFSPNRLRLRVETSRPARLLVNQNHHPGWKSNVGRVVSHEGLLAVDLAGGKQEVDLTFRPRAFFFGVWVSTLGLCAALALAWGRPRLCAGSLLAAVLLFASSFVLSDEPLPVPAAPTNADGSPALVAALPADATSLEVAFALPVTLEGVVPVEASDGTGHGRYILFFRVDGSVPRSVGVSVHFESSQGRRKKSDHDVIAASMFLADAPRGVLLRDVHSVALDARPGETWKMYVSLWHATGDHTRVPIRRASVPVQRDRALVSQR